MTGAGPSGLSWRELNETIERLRTDARRLERSGSSIQKEAAADILKHVQELERERSLHDPRPFTC